ncbi:MAG: AtpZ/AtpI family protein [Deltaproteobacteria bacterium]|nr:AtpZ/AtpI family protein [Deltaproteobacteria bacterium]MBW2121202.1 AtpZ/AtpI family protein [Deltaproteobacteria bacterium]
MLPGLSPGGKNLTNQCIAISLKADGTKRLIFLVGHYGTIGLEMGLSVAIGLFIGIVLDRYLGTKPWMALIFLILGVVAGFRALFRVVKEIQKQDRPANKGKE